MVPIDQTPFCAPATPINSIVVQEVLPCSRCWGLYCNPLFCGGPGPFPVYPVMGQPQQNQDYSGYPPSSGPSRPGRRNRGKGLREAESPYPLHVLHDSSATFLGGSSVVPDHVWNDANKTGGGKRWEARHWQAQHHPYEVSISSGGIAMDSVEPSTSTEEIDRDEVEISRFEVPLADPERYSSSESTAPLSSGTMVGDPASSTSTSISAQPISTTYYTRNLNTTDPIEEEDDAISLGSP